MGKNKDNTENEVKDEKPEIDESGVSGHEVEIKKESDDSSEASGEEEIKIPAEQEVQPPESESERYIRLAAEFDNYKKRTAREFGNLIRTANARLLRSLVEIADNFERALDKNNSNDNVDAYIQGIELIYNQITELLSKENVKPIEAVGRAFDPNLHEAMMQQESDEYEEGIVIQEIQKGYQIDEKVLRHAGVIVSSGSKTKNDKEENSEK
ncbi:MAG: nucleotide exchange factor GrpE [candidate division Zixibacteria bacterium]